MFKNDLIRTSTSCLLDEDESFVSRLCPRWHRTCLKNHFKCSYLPCSLTCSYVTPRCSDSPQPLGGSVGMRHVRSADSDSLSSLLRSGKQSSTPSAVIVFLLIQLDRDTTVRSLDGSILSSGGVLPVFIVFSTKRIRQECNHSPGVLTE